MGICEERDRRALTGLACARQARLKPILFSNTPGRNLHEPWINSLTKGSWDRLYLLHEWFDVKRRQAILTAMPRRDEFPLMICGPFQHHFANPAWRLTLNDFQRPDADH